MRFFLLCLLAFTLPCHATNYFSHGWEQDSTVSFGVNGTGPIYGYHGGARDCTVAHSGSCSMKLTIDGNDFGNNSQGLDIDQSTYPFATIRASPPVYYRWWMRINTGFDWGTGTAKTKSSRTGNVSGLQGYTGYVYDGGILIAECSDGGCLTNTGAGNTDSNLGISYNISGKADSAWHEYIVMVRPNTSASCTAGTNCNAQVKLWVDNVLVGSNVNWKLSNTSGSTMKEFWGGWMVSPYFQLNGAPGTGGIMYIDDVSTDTVYNSLLAKPANIRVSDLSQFLRLNIASFRTVPELCAL